MCCCTLINPHLLQQRRKTNCVTLDAYMHMCSVHGLVPNRNCHWNEKRRRKSSCVSKCAQTSEINLHRQMLYYLVCMCVCLSMSVLVYVLCVCMPFLLGLEHYINPREAESVSMATHPSSIPPPVESEMKGFIRRKGKKAASDWKREIRVWKEREN